MLYTADLTNLLSQWNTRLQSNVYNPMYKDAVGDCMYELNTLIEHSFEDESLYHEAWESKMADDYNSLYPNLPPEVW